MANSWTLTFQTYLPKEFLIHTDLTLKTNPEQIRNWWDYIDSHTEAEQKNRQFESLQYAFHHNHNHNHNYMKDASTMNGIDIKYIEALMYYVCSRYGVIILRALSTGEALQVLKK